MEFAVRVTVKLREGIADPQGATIERSLPALGYDGVSRVSVGKVIDFTLAATDEASAKSEVHEMCEKFLANPVIEDVVVEVAPA
ncbi:MAG: phosphoribosylformylglycinamidine synthase subunit PurS [Actinobacteria bacterium]|nr:phosphoribosylformylglycinamidine synthase subunit PurS [Actinomycetota bacterium]